MAEPIEVVLFIGIEKSEVPQASKLFWQAFSQKIESFLGPKTKGEAYIAKVLNTKNIFVAKDKRNNLVGLSGFRNFNGGVVGGTMSDLIAIYGTVGAIWRMPLLHLISRKENSNVLHLDALCVEKKSQYKGVGRKIILFAKKFAKSQALEAVELDVMSNNMAAVKFYRALDFNIIAEDRKGFLSTLFGIKSIYRMRLDL